MTDLDITPIMPADLGQALAFPGIYLEPPAGLPGAAHAPRVRRQGRLRRRMAIAASVVTAAAISLAGCSVAHHAPAAAGTPWMPAQASQAMQTARAELAPAHLPQHKAEPPRPVWDGRHPAVWTSAADPMCSAKIEGRHSRVRVGGRGPVLRGECEPDGPEFASWGIVSGGAR